MPRLYTGQTNRLLGYPADARLLIINADDFGMCHAVNQAIIRALTHGVLRSTTLMVPCPWAVHAMQFLGDHPDISFGVHLTVISEWVDYRWGPVTSREQVPSLLDTAGYSPTFEQMPALLAQVRLDELEREWRAQIDAASGQLMCKPFGGEQSSWSFRRRLRKARWCCSLVGYGVTAWCAWIVSHASSLPCGQRA